MLDLVNKSFSSVRSIGGDDEKKLREKEVIEREREKEIKFKSREERKYNNNTTY
jgi:hypothetical protein